MFKHCSTPGINNGTLFVKDDTLIAGRKKQHIGNVKKKCKTKTYTIILVLKNSLPIERIFVYIKTIPFDKNLCSVFVPCDQVIQFLY